MGLLTAALLISLGVVLARRAMRWRRDRLLGELPGRSPDRAVLVSRYDEIEVFIERSRCACGGRLAARSEGGVTRGSRAVRVVCTECVSCERSLELFFDLREVQH